MELKWMINEIEKIDNEINDLHKNFVDNQNWRQSIKDYYNEASIEQARENLDDATYEASVLADTLNEWDNNTPDLEDVEDYLNKHQNYIDDNQWTKLENLKQEYLATNDEEILWDFIEDAKHNLSTAIKKAVKDKYPSTAIDFDWNGNEWVYKTYSLEAHIQDSNTKKHIKGGQSDANYNSFVSQLIDQIPIITDVSYSSFGRSIYLNNGTIRISDHLKDSNHFLSDILDELSWYGYEGVINLIYRDGKLQNPKELELMKTIFKENKGGVKEFLLRIEKADLQKEIDELKKQNRSMLKK